MNRYTQLIAGFFCLLLLSCERGESSKTGEEEVPTTLEQHSSSVSSSSSDSGVSKTATSSSASSGSTPGAPTSFSFSTSSQGDDPVPALTSIRDIAENKEVRDYLQKEAIKLMLADKLIASENEPVSLSITDQMVMVNKQVLSDKEAKKYVELLKSKLSMGDVFTYSFRQN